MVASIRASSGSVEDAGTTDDLVIDVPTGTLDGDLLFLIIKSALASVPSGWTRMFSGAQTEPGIYENTLVCKRVASSEPASYTVPQSQTFPPTPDFTDGRVAQMIAVKDYASYPLVGYNVVSGGTTAGGDIHSIGGSPTYDSFLQIPVWTAYQAFEFFEDATLPTEAAGVTLIRNSSGYTLGSGYTVLRYIISSWERNAYTATARTATLPHAVGFATGQDSFTLFIPETVEEEEEEEPPEQIVHNSVETQLVARRRKVNLAELPYQVSSEMWKP